MVQPPPRRRRPDDAGRDPHHDAGDGPRARRCAAQRRTTGPSDRRRCPAPGVAGLAAGDSRPLARPRRSGLGTARRCTRRALRQAAAAQLVRPRGRQGTGRPRRRVRARGTGLRRHEADRRARSRRGPPQGRRRVSELAMALFAGGSACRCPAQTPSDTARLGDRGALVERSSPDEHGDRRHPREAIDRQRLLADRVRARKNMRL